MPDIKMLFIGGPLDRRIMGLSGIEHKVDGYHLETVAIKQIEGYAGVHNVPVMIADDRGDDALVDMCDVADLLSWFFTQHQPFDARRDRLRAAS